MKKTPRRVLAIHPEHRGFGFVVMEGARMIVDWGTKTDRRNDGGCVLRKIEKLVGQYRPDVVLLKERSRSNNRRSARIQTLCERIEAVCCRLRVKIHRVPERKIEALFSPFGETKQDRALAVIYKLPELRRCFPRRPTAGSGEDDRMKVCDSAVLALTFYADVCERSSDKARQRST